MATTTHSPSSITAVRPRGHGGRRRIVPRAQREKQMLEVAVRLFGERGFNGVSMDEIAEAVGVTKPMLYAYFDSKEGLYLASIERAGQPLLAAIRDAVDPALPPERRLWEGLMAVFRFGVEHRDTWAAFYAEASARGGAAATQVARVRQEIIEVLTALLMQAATDAGIADTLATEVEVQAHALIGSVEAVASWYAEHPDTAPELVALRLMNFAWMGFGDMLEGNLWLPPSPIEQATDNPREREEMGDST